MMGAILRADVERWRVIEAIRSGVVLEDEDKVDERKEWARACMRLPRGLTFCNWYGKSGKEIGRGMTSFKGTKIGHKMRRDQNEKW